MFRNQPVARPRTNKCGKPILLRGVSHPSDEARGRENDVRYLYGKGKRADERGHCEIVLRKLSRLLSDLRDQVAHHRHPACQVRATAEGGEQRSGSRVALRIERMAEARNWRTVLRGHAMVRFGEALDGLQSRTKVGMTTSRRGTDPRQDGGVRIGISRCDAPHGEGRRIELVIGVQDKSRLQQIDVALIDAVTRRQSLMHRDIPVARTRSDSGRYLEDSRRVLEHVGRGPGRTRGDTPAPPPAPTIRKKPT